MREKKQFSHCPQSPDNILALVTLTKLRGVSAWGLPLAMFGGFEDTVMELSSLSFGYSYYLLSIIFCRLIKSREKPPVPDVKQCQ